MFVLDEEVGSLEEPLPAGLAEPDLLAGGQADLELLLHHLEGRVGNVERRILKKGNR